MAAFAWNHTRYDGITAGYDNTQTFMPYTVSDTDCGSVVIVTRDVLDCPAEPSNTIGRDVPMGTMFYRYKGPTYGCISNNGVALTELGKEFFEFPKDAVKDVF